MSRLIVKGLPKYLTEDRLKDHFSKEGSVSDVKLMKKRNGESRQFAFIGYKSGADAEKAVKYFDRTFIDTAKIEVSLAKTFSDPTVPKAIREKRKLAEFSLAEQEERLLRQREEQGQYKRKKFHKKSKLDQEIAANPKLLEFIETLKPSSQVQSWKNDSLADGSGAPSAEALDDALAQKDGKPDTTEAVDAEFEVVRGSEAESDDEYDYFQRKSDIEEEEMILFSRMEDTHPEKAVDDGIARDEAVSDLQWLKQRRIRMKESEEILPEHKTCLETTQVASKQDLQNSNYEKVETFKSCSTLFPSLSEEETTEAKLMETGRLFIRNILYDSSEEEFRELFSLYGPILEVHIAVDTRTGKSKGFVYVQFQNTDDAVSAYRAMDKQIFQGRLLHILAGEVKKSHKLDEFALKNLPLKKQRELKKKTQANKAQFNWNSLYLNNDAVLDSVALKLGVSKSELIDPQNSSLAVKQALAEAHVIGDVRKFFEDKGVDLTTFDQKERDDKVVLAKNFPFGTTSQDIHELFAEYGLLRRVVMPSSGTIAIVEFRDAPSGRAAFTKLAYRMFKKSILYLEKGPKDLFTRDPNLNEVIDTDTEKTSEEVVDAKITARGVLANDATDNESDEEMLDKGPTVSIFVKNLSFSTTTPQLATFFEKLPGFAVALVKTKPDPKNAGNVLSMGFGFAEFKTKENAEAAIRAMDNTVLDGHRVQLKLSHRKPGSAVMSGAAAKVKSEKTNKIIIKNLPFEASRKDVLELFGAYGQVKSARVPKKFDKSARGFAFVEYTLLKEAESAMNQMKGVHLLGRRLVMQYAEKESANAESEIEKMTQKVKKQAASREMAAARLAGQGKFQLEESENPFDEF